MKFHAANYYDGAGGVYGPAVAVTLLETVPNGVAYFDTTYQFPAKSVAIACPWRIKVAVPTVGTIDVGIAGATTRYGTGFSPALDTWDYGWEAAGTESRTERLYTVATKIRFSFPGGNTTTANGRIQVTLWYKTIVAPT